MFQLICESTQNTSLRKIKGFWVVAPPEQKPPQMLKGFKHKASAPLLFASCKVGGIEATTDSLKCAFHLC